MPTYEFRCPDGTIIEKMFRISEVPETIPCPDGSGEAVRIISGGAALLFKGSGFYITDYGKDGKKDQRTAGSAESKSGDASGAKAGDAGGSPKADAKSDSAAASRAEGKSESKSDSSKAAPSKAPGSNASSPAKPPKSND